MLQPLPGCLVGSWRGIEFHVPDISTPFGRQIASIGLPGTDITLHEDFGLYTGAIRVSGLIVGDDVTAQALALKAACEAKGPGTLVHPWFGPMMVVLKDPADIRFQSDRLRGVSFSASFERWSGASDLGSIGTLGLISVAVAGLDSVVLDLLDLGVDLVGGSIADVLGDVLGGILAVIDVVTVGGDLSTVLAGTLIGDVALSAAISLVEDATGAAGWIVGVVDAIAAAGVPAPSPAIGVGPLGRALEASVDPWSTVSALLSIATSAAALSTSATEEGASLVHLAVAVAAIAASAEPLAAVEWDSRQQAMAARVEISAVISTLTEAAIAVIDTSSTTSAARRTTWTALTAARRAIRADLDDRIGRLPSVMTISPPTRVSAWIIAHYLFGDDPKTVRSGFEDIVTRNRLAHPSICDVDPVEVLPQ